MKFQEAIVAVIDEFGREILNNPNVVNILSDFNAYEESKALKVILRNVIIEGYLDQILYVKDWDKSSSRILDKFVDNTGFQEDKAIYLLNSLAHGLGLTPQQAEYRSAQNSGTTHSAPSTSSHSHPSQPTKPTPHVPASSLNLSASQIGNLSEEKQIQYKEDAETYLDSIIEVKGNPKNELGTNIVITSESYDNRLQFRFEIDGPITVKHEDYITFNVVIYGANSRVLTKLEATRYKSKKTYEVVETNRTYGNQIKTVGNVSKIVVYWDID